ncbi:hypothetical protein ACX3V1_16285, partial [Escherichia coli]
EMSRGLGDVYKRQVYTHRRNAEAKLYSKLYKLVQ